MEIEDGSSGPWRRRRHGLQAFTEFGIENLIELIRRVDCDAPRATIAAFAPDGRSLDHDIVVQHDADHDVRRFDLRRGSGHAGFRHWVLGTKGVAQMSTLDI